MGLMKSLIRSFLINALSLWSVSQIATGIAFLRGYETLALAAVVLATFNLLVKPLINILLLPINILTLGTLRWLVNVFTLFLVTLIVPDFKISGFHFVGFSYQGIVVPSVDLGTVGAFVAFSLLLSFISGFLFWLTK